MMNTQSTTSKSGKSATATPPISTSPPKPRSRKKPLKTVSKDSNLPASDADAAAITDGMAATIPAQSTPAPVSGSGSDSSSNPALRSPPSSTKQARLVTLLQQPEGASLEEMMRVTGWQAHSIRGIISGVLRKKLGLDVRYDELNESGKRRYRIAGQEEVA